jgi:hypothetical protein
VRTDAIRRAAAGSVHFTEMGASQRPSVIYDRAVLRSANCNLGQVDWPRVFAAATGFRDRDHTGARRASGCMHAGGSTLRAPPGRESASTNFEETVERMQAQAAMRLVGSICSSRTRPAVLSAFEWSAPT